MHLPPAVRTVGGPFGRVLTVVVILVLVWQSTQMLARRWETATRNPLDFAMSRASVELMLHGYDPYRIARYNLRSSVAAEVWAKVRHFDPLYLPSALTPMIPYTLLEFDTAVRAWWWTNVLAAIALLGGLFLMGRRPQAGLAYPLVVWIFLVGGPFQTTLNNGQNPVVALALLVGALLAAERQRVVSAGVLLALSMIKYALVIPAALPLFLTRARWRAVALAAAAHLVAHLAWAARIGSSPLALVGDVLHLDSKLLAYQGVDVWAVARRVAAAMNAATLAPWLAGVAIVGLLVVVIRLWRRSSGELSSLGWLSVLVPLSLAIPYHRPYDYVGLVIPLFWAATLTGRRGWRALLWGGVVLLYQRGVIIPDRWMQGPSQSEVQWLLDAAAFYATLTATLVIAHRGDAHRARGRRSRIYGPSAVFPGVGACPRTGAANGDSPEWLKRSGLRRDLFNV